MAKRPIVLIHGYSASDAAFDRWREVLMEKGYLEHDIHVLTYRSLTNEVTIDDIAEGFDRALKMQIGLDDDEAFDAIVHSTGMLVVRAWLTRFAGRIGEKGLDANERSSRLKHLIALAPATFGSPLAHKGRGWLGSAVKGNPTEGPDFREAGDLVLDGLELASRYTWDLAHKDLLTVDPWYGIDESTPYVFTFCGTEGYDGLAAFVNQPGTDGTVRFAGCPLNTRKFTLDLRRSQKTRRGGHRTSIADWSNADIPLVLIRDLNHSTIMSRPSGDLVELVMDALNVSDPSALERWLSKAQSHMKKVVNSAPPIGRWQQIVFRVLDDRDDPVRDYVIEFVTKNEAGDWVPMFGAEKSSMKVHTYTSDPSLRCFHIDLRELAESQQTVGLRLLASSGTELVGYRGYTQEDIDVSGESTGDVWSATIDLTNLRHDDRTVNFFHPFTTTFVEIRLEREPMPLMGSNDLAYFADAPRRRAVQKALDLAAEARKREIDTARIEELLAQFKADVEDA